MQDPLGLKSRPSVKLLVVVSLLTSGILLSSCGGPSKDASPKDYLACSELGFINYYMALKGSTYLNIPSNLWNLVIDSAMNDSNPTIVSIGHSLDRDWPVALSGGKTQPVAHDLVHLMAACQALNWQRARDPAT